MIRTAPISVPIIRNHLRMINSSPFQHRMLVALLVAFTNMNGSIGPRQSKNISINEANARIYFLVPDATAANDGAAEVAAAEAVFFVPATGTAAAAVAAATGGSARTE